MLQQSPDRPAGRDELDWRLLAPLILHVGLFHTVVGMVRVTTSYRTVELDLAASWLGFISAGFAILPIFLALKIGRFIDRGHDAQTAWIGTGLVLIAAMGLWLWPDSGLHLFFFTVILGTGHMCCMASHQMLTVRAAATPRARDAAFGHFMVAISVGQGLGPFIVGWVGGGATVPPTGHLFALGIATAVVCQAVAFLIRPAPRRPEHAATGDVVPLKTLIRLPGLFLLLYASVATTTALDLLTVYLPLLGTERGIDANHIGLLLAVRSFAALVARAFYARLNYMFGRLPLTLATTFVSAAAFVLLATPWLPAMYVAVVVIGSGLGIASTLTLSALVDVAPAQARGTAMSLRITGNRIGLAFVPFLAGFIAAATGVAGVLFATAASLTAAAVALRSARRQT